MTSELTNLKNLWQTSLSESEKAFWHQQLATPLATAEDLRNLLREKLDINLQHDSQLYDFRQWEAARRACAIPAERIAQELRPLATEHPDWNPARLHEELLGRLCLQTAFARQDTLALNAVRAAIRCRTLDLNREKFTESLRSKIFAGIDALDVESKKHPRVRAAVQNLREAVAAETPHPNN